MLSVKKKNPFILLEILISLILLSGSLPLILRNFSALIFLNREWQQEESLQEKIDESFLVFKQSLLYKDVLNYLDSEEKNKPYGSSMLSLTTQTIPITFFIKKMDHKKDKSLLIEIHLQIPKNIEQNRKFSQIYCLKK